MSFKEREGMILEYLRENKEASVGELCCALFVSEPTMRRDLAALNWAGKIIRTHGGAMHRSDPGENLPQEYREREHSDAKVTIGKKCLSLIKDGDTVMVDGSSTALELIRVIGNRKSIIVITNSAKASMILSGAQVRTFVSGGELAANSHAYVGSYAEDFLRSFNADVCFFSVRTLTRDGFLTDNAISENSVRKIMMSRSKRSVLMLDSEKIGEPCVSTLAHLRDVSYVVSERDISDEFNEYKEKFI